MTRPRSDQLLAQPVWETVRRLESRIAARFPERGLLRVAGELAELVGDVQQDAAFIRGRLRTARLLSRVLLALLVVGTAVVLVVATRDAVTDSGRDNSLDWVPLIESAINDLVFAGLAIYFLFNFPERLERGHLLDLLHRLRSLAHVIDMHQLTKDPERLRDSYRASPASIDVRLDRQQMESYLDYCSELLSLTGKAAALCAEKSRDSVVLTTVSTLETLTNDMSRKIWQKIQLLPPE
ncbi:MAG: hypothetical protein M3237_15375 [Actinomycetota bacterium]|nr:hypothetical protein [Actinomycetota bacterium]